MTAKIRDLDETLPKVKPTPRRQPATKPPTPKTPTPKGKDEPTMVELIIDDAVAKLDRKGNKRGTTSAQFTEAGLFKQVANRVSIAKYGRNPRRELEQMQKTLSLLTWELGIILEDIDAFGETTTKESSK